MTEHLRRNALDFIEEAENDIKILNLAVFHLEQALQLSLKYVLFNLTGSFPKIHDVKELLARVINLTGNKTDMMNKYSIHLDLLVEAYISSRYLSHIIL
ncbi:HEPN domain-containing protein [Sulfurisphaera javensis]|uniref:HEPN domain-containing protein n=1 Tax=Sulfurisphaera javensis TaxID=2049879 RepID=A0AAT9GVF8_9CREN